MKLLNQMKMILNGINKLVEQLDALSEEPPNKLTNGTGCCTRSTISFLSDEEQHTVQRVLIEKVSVFVMMLMLLK